TCGVRLTCSAGFYVRSFAHALGECLGTGGGLETLRRIRSGEFTLDQAITLDELMGYEGAPNGWLVPLERLLGGFPSVTVTDEGRVRVSHGRELERTHYQVAGERVAP